MIIHKIELEGSITPTGTVRQKLILNRAWRKAFLYILITGALLTISGGVLKSIEQVEVIADMLFSIGTDLFALCIGVFLARVAGAISFGG